MNRTRFSLKWFLFSFEGRVGRQAYWAYTLGMIFVFIACLMVLGAFSEATAGDAKVPKALSDEISLGVLLSFGLLVPLYGWTNYAVHAKRWHDRDKSGWWSLIGFVPYIGGIWMLVECGFLTGSDGPNRFGDDPQGTDIAVVFD